MIFKGDSFFKKSKSHIENLGDTGQDVNLIMRKRGWNEGGASHPRLPFFVAVFIFFMPYPAAPTALAFCALDYQWQ